MTRIHRTTAPKSPHRRLPHWLRRGLRAWARCTRRFTRAASRGTWIVLDSSASDDLAELAATDERRCGWFDSSQDLREGLCVSEHQPSDTVCAQLPVMAWVQLQLSGWRPTLAAG